MTIIWHNPRCSKSRQTLALLEEKGEDITIRRYLEEAPTGDDIRKVLELLGMEPIDITRTSEAIFKQLGLSKTTDSDTLIAALAANPKLIERPIVIKGDKAALGRPPEAVLDVL